ncbi:cadherin cytoplasmic region [Cooperia oncophora]
MVCMDFWKGAFCTCPEGANAMLGDDGQLVGCGETLAVAKLGISNPAIILILVSLVLLIMLVMLMLVYARRQTTPFESVRPEDLNRDNLRPYAIEGGGEADNDQYSIANLRKPVMPIEGNGIMGPPAPMYARPPIDDRLRSQLHDLESDQNAAPFDEIRIYEDEKDTVSVVTLESLGSIPETERQPVMLVMLMLVYARRQTTPFESVRPEDLNRDNLRPYAIEGGGEADNDQYSIANLRKPVMPIEGNGIMGPPAPMYARPPIAAPWYAWISGKERFVHVPEGANAMLGDDGQLVGCGETLAVAKLGISNPAIILILVSLVLLIMLVMLMLVYARRQTTPFESVRPEDLNRDNLRPYAIEGGGEADNDQYVRGSGDYAKGQVIRIESHFLSASVLDDRLRSQLHDLESDQNAAPFDEIRIYEDEKDTYAGVVTLESLGSIPETERQPVSRWNHCTELRSAKE